MKCKKFLLIALCVLLCLSVSACINADQTRPSWKGGPQDGLWYCEELKMQLYVSELDASDDEALRNGSFDSYSYVIVDEEIIMCMLSNSAAVGEYTVNVNSLYTDPEQTFLNAELVSLNETSWVVKDNTGKQYTFKIVDSFSLEQIKNDNKESIEAYAGTTDIGETYHIETAKEKALSLFKTGLGITEIWKESDLTVSYNHKDLCWLIVGAPSASAEGKTPHALIQKDGQVIAAWLK